ncbi:MAG TPA: hypothetical protein VGP06_20300 [Janthinobacterium sp.]|nr:hypothetical protein [Janthinobacterium sp.]
MDQQKLRSLVFEKTGIKIDSDDPVFALVALNEAVLAETVERHVALIGAATEELLAQARAGGHGGARPSSAAVPAHGTFAPAPAVPAQALMLLAPRELRLLAAAAGIAVLSALLVLGGQVLFFTPAPAPVPAPVVRAPALTAEQAAAIAEGEKLARAVQKLDQKSRKLIEAEMQKP